MQELETTDLFGNTILRKHPVSRDELCDILYLTISKMGLNEFVGTITNEFREVMEYISLTQGKDTCQNTSLLFNPHRLSTRSKGSKLSVYEAIKEKSFVSGLSRAILFDNQYEKNRDFLFSSFRLGINGVQYINEFQPYVARDILLELGATAESKILDPCGGWGGRMIGCSVVSDYYECCEPSGKTFEGLNKLAEFISTMNKTFTAKIHKLPFEEIGIEKGEYDFAITSPPYYDTEIYSNEETNSLNRYKTFSDWKDGFYIPMIRKTLEALKSRGVFVLNIGSRVYPLNEILLENFGKHKIEKMGNYLSGSAGLGKTGEGEMFYLIRAST
jgi:hypothetical protein